MIHSEKKSTKYIQDEIDFKGRFSKSVFETLYHTYRPYFTQLKLAIVIGFLGRLLVLSNANIVGRWVDSQSSNSQNNDQPWLLLLLLATLAGFALTVAFRILLSRLSAKAVSYLYDEVTLRASRYPMWFFDTTPAGRIITRFSSDYGNVFRMFGGPIAEFISLTFDLIAMFVLITLASPWFIPLVALMIGAYWGIFLLNRENLRKARRELSQSRAPSIAHFAETAQGAATIRNYLKQIPFKERFAKLNNNYLQNRLKTSRLITLFSIEMNVLTALFLLLTGVLGIYLKEHGFLSLGQLGVAFSFISLSGFTIQVFFEWISQLEEALVGVERLDNYLRREIEAGVKLPSSSSLPTIHPVYSIDEELSPSPFQGLTKASIEVKDLWLKYRPALPYALQGVSFTIEPGDRIGIIGRTGSGKTSLIQALFGLYPIEKGSIQINGIAPTDMRLFRQGISLISQDPILFRGTLRDNLKLTENLRGRDTRDQDARDQELFEILKKVGLDAWASVEGLNMSIEEKGKNLSLGERQLVCMARCLCQNTPIVIMDEATSSVDPQSEELLVSTTYNHFKDKTLILIAHRLSTLSLCNKVLWLEQGKVHKFDLAENVLSDHDLSDHFLSRKILSSMSLNT